MVKKSFFTAGIIAALVTGVFATPEESIMKHLTTSMFTPHSKVVIGPLPDTLLSDPCYYRGYQKRVWYLENNVVVAAGCTLQVKPGTHICGDVGHLGPYTYDRNTSMLIMAPGSVLLAEGTPDSVIVFTSLRDELNDKNDLGPGAKGLWGGITWCGTAPISMDWGGDWGGYPGVPENIPGVYYGGNNPHYYGGKMKYVSIRHAGFIAFDNGVIGGLNLWGIGDSTQISNVETFACEYHGFRFCGGTVNTKYLVSAFNDGDMFDIDEGYKGKNQFWFALEQEYEGDRGGEFDGKHSDADHFSSNPVIYNYTFIGGGSTCSNPLDSADKGNQGIMLRDSMGGTFCNGIVTEFGSWAVIRGKHSIDYNVIAKPFGNSGDSIRMAGNIFYNCHRSNTWNGMIFPSSDIPYLKANSNDTLDPMLRGIARKGNAQPVLDPRPVTGSPAYSGYVALPANTSDFTWTDAPYRGAFSSTDLWISGWTALDEQNICAKLLFISPGAKVSKSADNMRMSFFLLQPGVGVSTSNPALSVKIDGVEVKSTFLSKVHNYPLTTGGYCFYVEYPTGVSFVPLTGKPLVGPHRVDAVFPLTNGQIVKNSATWTFIE